MQRYFGFLWKDLRGWSLERSSDISPEEAVESEILPALKFKRERKQGKINLFKVHIMYLLKRPDRNLALIYAKGYFFFGGVYGVIWEAKVESLTCLFASQKNI